MLTITILETFSQTKVNDVDIIFVMLLAPDEEVVGFDVSVDDSVFVDFLNSLDLEGLEV